MLRRDGAISPLEDCPPLNEQNLLAAVEAVTRVVPERLKQFHETGDLDIALTAYGLPRFRVNVYPAARRDLVRVPRHPTRRPEFRAAGPAARRLVGSPTSTAGSSSCGTYRPRKTTSSRRSSITSTARGRSTWSRSKIRSRSSIHR